MKKNLDTAILNLLEREEFLPRPEILKILQQSDKSLNNGTLGNHLDKLQAQGKIRYRHEGYGIDKEWKEGTPKAFILVELAHRKQPGNYQAELVKEIRGGFDRGEHKGLNLMSLDIVMGAEFSLIIVVYSDDLHPIGRFVKSYLLTHALVSKTRTIMVWPTEPRSPT